MSIFSRLLGLSSRSRFARRGNIPGRSSGSFLTQLLIESLESRNPAAALLPLLTSDGSGLVADQELSSTQLAELEYRDELSEQSTQTDQTYDFGTTEALDPIAVDQVLQDSQEELSASSPSSLQSPPADPLVSPLSSQLSSNYYSYDSLSYEYQAVADPISTAAASTTSSTLPTSPAPTTSGSSTPEVSLNSSPYDDEMMMAAEGEGSGSSEDPYSGGGSGDGSGSGSGSSSSSGGDGSGSGDGSGYSNLVPTITYFGGLESPSSWTFEGTVHDDDPSSATITFGGLLEGYSATPDPYGNFYITVSLSDSGTVTVQAEDNVGQLSNIESYNVYQT